MCGARERKLVQAHARFSNRPIEKAHVERLKELHFPTDSTAVKPVYPESDTRLFEVLLFKILLHKKKTYVRTFFNRIQQKK